MGFIGETRFSLLKPESPNWVASNGSRFQTLAEYRDHLYAPERLDARCDLFLDVSLPQLRLASAGFDYYHVVSFSDSLPDKYQLRLEKAAREFEFLILDRQSETTSESSWLRVARSKFAPGPAGTAGQPFGWFRLDDDDLLSADYFAQMMPYITAANAGMQVSLGRGLTALYEGGDFYNLRMAQSPLIALGLLSVCMLNAEGEVIRPVEASHRESDLFNPVILDSRKVSYLWVRHVNQDTELRGGPRNSQTNKSRALNDLERLPKLPNRGEAFEAFPTCADRFSPAPCPELTLVVEASGPQALDEQGVRLDTGTVGKLIQAELTLEFGPTALPGNALVGLDLVDRSGNAIGAGEVQDELRKRGLYRSDVAGIGYFNYLNAKPGVEDYSIIFNLPTGVFCNSIIVRRWNNSELDIKLMRCDIFGLKGETSPPKDTAKIFIWGSCVSRDPFEMESDMEVVDYRARSSLGSAFADTPADWEGCIDVGQLSSPFQRRMVTSDVTKSLRKDLRQTGYDALVLDFIDDRMNTIDLNGSVVTDSPELAATGFTAPAETKHEPWSDSGWALRRAGIEALLGVVDPARIVINRVYWATVDDAGEPFEHARWIAKNNAFLRQLYAIFEEVPGVRFIDYPEELLLAASEHHWGRQPYHYAEAVNRHFLTRLSALLAVT